MIQNPNSTVLTRNHTTMTTTDHAEAKVQELLDQRDLYVTNSRHERRLLACIKDLWKAVASEEEVAWPGFRTWLLDHKERGVEHANVFIGGYLEENRHQASCRHTTHLYIQAWRAWGIDVSDRIRKQIAQFDSEEWRPALLTRRNQAQANKLRQFESLDKLWPSMVDYMLDVTGENFRTQLKSVTSNRGSHEGVATSSFNEMDILCRKSDAEAQRHSVVHPGVR